MKKYYEEAKYNAAFDRCVDVMSQMLQKYGHQVLDKLEQDAPQKVEHSKESKRDYLRSSMKLTAALVRIMTTMW